MIPIRAAGACLLGLLIVLTSVGAGHARGKAHVAGEIVICSGDGVVAIRVDVDGMPVERAVRCPDCVLHLFLDPVVPVDVAACAMVAVPACWPDRSRDAAGARHQRPPARAPPPAA